jgi:Zn-dependent M28 family amino/carboxypeptidase
MKRILLPFLVLLPGCIFVLEGGYRPDHASGGIASDPPGESISSTRLLERIRVLSSDEYEGRGPGTAGEEKTVAFVTKEFQAIGLEPGNPDGSFVQKVPLVGLKGTPTGSFEVGGAAGKTIGLEFPKDAVALTRRFVPSVDVEDSDVVFVGYGVVAPEYSWDDYKGVDVRGKTIVMLVNDPPVPDPKDPSKLDDSVFKGRAMTYYGRWTYKYEIAAEKGAAAAVIVHQDGPAGYPWSVVDKSWSREVFDIDTPDGNAGRAAVEGWITLDKAKELFSACGKDFAALEDAARTREFRPVDLGARARFHVASEVRRVESKNVVAKLAGSDPKVADECLVYSAHWDHLGKSDGASGPAIFHGAVDNASGTSGLLEIAQAFARGPRPRRTILFLSVTAEEKGLLGSKWYAAHPLAPLEKTLADINMDSLNPWGRTSDVISVGYGQSTLDEVLLDAAARAGRSVKSDPQPEKGAYYRSDHFEFAKVGVPALYADSGVDALGKPPGWGLAKGDDFTAHDYHQPSDVVKPDWDLSGAVDDLALLVRVGRAVADGDRWPEWKDGSEFKARREAMLRPAR